MIEVSITKKDGTKALMICHSIEIKGCCIVSNSDKDPIQMLINLNNVDKVEVKSDALMA